MTDINSIDLEKFEGYGSKVSRKISITKSYSFGIPPAFFKDNDLNRYFSVFLYYNKPQNIIAFKFEPAGIEGGFKLIKYGKGDKEGASFVARSFFTTYNISPEKYKGHYSAEKGTKNGIGEMFWIKLNEDQKSDK